MLSNLKLFSFVKDFNQILRSTMSNLFEPLCKIFIPPFVSFIFLVALLVFAVLSLPVYLYRWIITSARKWSSQGKNVELLCESAQIIATEITTPTGISPRCIVVATLVIHGHIELNELYDKMEKNAIQAVDHHGNPKYSQLQQYPESRMGYLFWKKDVNFQLKNHLKLHVLNKTGSDLSSDTFLTKTCEQLLNKRYPPKRSPWEIHLVHNYKNSRLLKDMTVDKDNSKLTLVIFGIHHCLGDGYGFISLAMDLFGTKPESIAYQEGYQMNQKLTMRRTIISGMEFFANSFYEWSRLVSFHFKPTSIFHADDWRKAGSQHYSRATPIPMHKVKEIRARFGVKFASVINSCFAAALGKMSVKMDQRHDALKSIILGNILPKPDHPMKFAFHSYIMMHEVPTDTNVNPVERLLRCEASAEKIRNSPQPILFDFLVKLLGRHLPHVSKYLAKNRSLAVATTNFRGPQEPLFWEDKKLLAIDFTAGGLDGVCGIVICIYGYADRVQICAAAEKGVISEDELKRLLEMINEEIDLLYTITKNGGQI